MRALMLIGTRPEVIKMAPIIKTAATRRDLSLIVCTTGQHEELLRQALSVFGLVPDIRLSVMEPEQSLNQLFSRLLSEIDGIIKRVRPDWVLVHGDTSTAAAGALASFHRRVPVGHVEAGLRSGDMTQPWPEEMNRCLVDMLADLLFAPTERARRALLAEGVTAEKIEVTGNTVIDALLMAAALIDSDPSLQERLLQSYGRFLNYPKLVLVTGHRRENFGGGFVKICTALKQLGEDAGTCVLYPVHLNPDVQRPVQRMLSDAQNVFLIDPVTYIDFVFLMRRATVVLTDSGGIQEEAPTFGVPVLVMRNVTERPEAVEAGVAQLVGTDPNSILAAVRKVPANTSTPANAMLHRNPFGDGRASQRIIDRMMRAAPRRGRGASEATAGAR